MKYLIVTLTLLVSFTFVKAQVPRPVSAAMITFTEKENTHDFGIIPQNTPVIHSFTFKNTGKSPFILVSVLPSCGCTTVEWPKEPIKPGASASIKVTFNAASPGIFTKNVAVTTNASAAPTILYIKGEVKPR